jgi:alpha-glucosidase
VSVTRAARSGGPGAASGGTPWWRDAVVYEVYPRSFADADGDGVGDLAGVVSRLPYLRDLGVDAIWVTPFYASPLRDGGYDVTDYERPDPSFGALADAERLIATAHDLGLRVLFDIVPNHTSSDHRWFREALATPAGEGGWGRYHCVRGRGPEGAEPPNGWRSVFGGPAWTAIAGPDGRPSGFWYLHLFDPGQPDLNWSHPDVAAEHERVLRFWFDRDVDGFRIDVAHGLVKADGYPDRGTGDASLLAADDRLLAGAWDQPGVHDVYRRWRRLADSYDPPRVFCGEAWVRTPADLAQYLRPDELHTAFNFHYLKAGYDADELRAVIDESLRVAGLVGAPATWVLSNHDVERHASRLGSVERARAATLVMLALPGGAYLYQGEELGLPEVRELAPGDRDDPVFRRSGGAELGRDGCRVPLPWSGAAPSYGFGPASASWLPQPAAWAGLTVERQAADPASTLRLYRRALVLRRTLPALGDGPMHWLDVPGADPARTLAFERPDAAGGVTVVANTGAAALALPAALGRDVLLASTTAVALDRAGTVVVPPDAAVWLRGRNGGARGRRDARG